MSTNRARYAIKVYVHLGVFVRPSHEAEFLEHYGPDGTWVKLFRQAPGCVETLLLRDRDSPLRYVTVDRWQSAEAFRTRFARQYAELDEQCAGLTISETAIGTFSE